MSVISTMNLPQPKPENTQQFATTLNTVWSIKTDKCDDFPLLLADVRLVPCSRTQPHRCKTNYNSYLFTITLSPHKQPNKITDHQASK